MEVTGMQEIDAGSRNKLLVKVKSEELGRTIYLGRLAWKLLVVSS